MAKTRLLIPNAFRLGDCVVYALPGVDKLVIRTIGDMNKRKRKSAP